jgi:hypothetical protein
MSVEKPKGKMFSYLQAYGHIWVDIQEIVRKVVHWICMA